MSKRQQSKKKPGHKIRVPSSIVGGGLNRSAGTMHSDKEYKRVNQVDMCPGCNQPWEDCQCDESLPAIDWDHEDWSHDEDWEEEEPV